MNDKGFTEALIRLALLATPDELHDLLNAIADMPAAHTARPALLSSAASIFYSDK